MRVSVKQKCFQFVLESVQRGFRRPQIVWQTVPHSWSTDREAAVTVTCPLSHGDKLFMSALRTVHQNAPFFICKNYQYSGEGHSRSPRPFCTKERGISSQTPSPRCQSPVPRLFKMWIRLCVLLLFFGPPAQSRRRKKLYQAKTATTTGYHTASNVARKATAFPL